MPKTGIIIKATFQATHWWPDCPFEEVAFLRNTHRHVFHVEVTIETNKDRGLEFFMEKNKLNEFLSQFEGTHLGSLSCESLAEMICKHMEANMVSVFEDGENGGFFVP